MDAIQIVADVKRRLVDLAITENYVRDKEVFETCREVWLSDDSNARLVSELWVEGAFRGKLSQDTLARLAKEGIFPHDLLAHIERRDVFPVDRLLYDHQSKALRACANVQHTRPALIITAGTGLGKTESFLLPMLADLWNHTERSEEGGMRCLILYPMNALVADQVERIYRWLQGQDRLTLFHFTSETPENHRFANHAGEPKWNKCRFRTRQQARGFESDEGKKMDPLGRVPDIVITNYSMLEYMLCRPQDCRFFGPDLRCIILDEAHLYTGALAAEITMLLRRVKHRSGVASKNILHIATSATLGGDDEDLRRLASSIFSTQLDTTHVLRGQYEEQDLGSVESPPLTAPSASAVAGYANLELTTIDGQGDLLTDKEDTVEELSQAVSSIVSEDAVARARKAHPSTPARFLHDCLRESPTVRTIIYALSHEAGGVLSLCDLSKRLFLMDDIDFARKATTVLLKLGASARSDAKNLPLIPHRLHLLARAPSGLSVCLNPKCTGREEWKLENLGCLQAYADRCIYCDCVLLPLHRCNDCGQWVLAGYEDQERFRIEPGYYAEGEQDISFYLLSEPLLADLEQISIDPKSGIWGAPGTKRTKLWRTKICPVCGVVGDDTSEDESAQRSTRHFIPFYRGRNLALSVIAETVLHGLPCYPGNSKLWKPGEGRRLLCFSDSRRSAARLGPLLTNQHEKAVLRAAISDCVKNMSESGDTEIIEHLQSEIASIERKLGTSIGGPLRVKLEKERDRKKADLAAASQGISFEDFAQLLSKEDGIREILDRDSGEKHPHGMNERGEEYWNQSVWGKNKRRVAGCIEGLLATELSRVDPRRLASVETLGLLEIVYPGVSELTIPPLLEEKLPTNSVIERIAGLWPDIVSTLLDTLRQHDCLSWSEETETRKWLGEGVLWKHWSTRSKGGYSNVTFVGVTERSLRRWFATKVLLAAGVQEDKVSKLAVELLEKAFDQIYSKAINGEFLWLTFNKDRQTKGEETDKALQILLDRLLIRKPSKFYKCPTTGTIWTRSALGWAPTKACRGGLFEIADGELNSDPRWGRARRELSDEPLFRMGLWAEEHSAQIGARENRRLQELFKSGVRNVLSSTTTMELGIDIGGLNGVLLSNVPPGPANHRQRAGRAGRRSDGSAIVVSYSRDSVYDREVFHRFGDFLRQDLRRPTVLLDRDKIVRRHLYAVFLGDFMKSFQPRRVGTMHAFGTMGNFCGVDVPPYWDRYSSPKPAWNPRLHGQANLFAGHLESLAHQHDAAGFPDELTKGTALSGLDWHTFIKDAHGRYTEAMKEWKEDFEQLRDSWKEVTSKDSDAKAVANSIRYQISIRCDITVIEWLADHRFLPRYGFPVNLQQLSVLEPDPEGKKESERVRPSERYRLERSSLLALSEYVPGSRVLVSGKVATSRGVTKHWAKGSLGYKHFALHCPNSHIYISTMIDDPCPQCREKPSEIETLLFPRFGYSTAGWDPPTRETDFDRVGKVDVCPIEFIEHKKKPTVIPDFANCPGLCASYLEESLLFIRNTGEHGRGFAVCTKCGYSESEDDYGKGSINLPKGFAIHPTIWAANRDRHCWNKDQSPVLRNHVLAAKELTDMILLELPAPSSYDVRAVYSMGRALVLSGTRLLQLDSRELEMVLFPSEDNCRGIVIYDTSPGGSGHCIELLRMGGEWLCATRDRLFVNEEHDIRCERACLDCILDFSGQYRADQLDRRGALNVMSRIMQ